MNSKNVKIGVIGVGKMGEYHLQKYLKAPKTKCVGVYEPNKQRAAEIKEKYGVKAFNNLAECLFEVDAVTVASPTATHYLISKQALTSGVSVLVEKPIADTIPRARELVKLSKDLGLILQVGMVERFRYRFLSKGMDLGYIQYVESNRLSSSLSREQDIDVVTDLMIHDLDLILSLVGRNPQDISAIGVPVVTKHFDLANARLEFPNGAVANLNVSRVSPAPYRRFRIFSSRAYASMDFITNNVRIFIRNSKQEIEQRIIENLPIDALEEQCLHFIECVRNSTSPIVTGEDGLRALEYAQKVKQCIEKRAENISWKKPKSTFPKERKPHKDSIIQV